MSSNNSGKTTSLPKMGHKQSLTPRPIPQARPTGQTAKNKPAKTGKK